MRGRRRSPRTHGSAVFTRGQTQVLTVVHARHDRRRSSASTTCRSRPRKRYIHHYNFPPFSRGRGAAACAARSRRDIGHGALAERALLRGDPVDAEDFPYTIRARLRDRSSRTARPRWPRVCGSTLALMDAGVPITAPVAGIAMGLDQGGRLDYVDPHRHPGRRGPPRRHGLQGRRHRRGRHRPPDGHQDHAASRRRSCGTRSRRRRDARVSILGTMAETIAEPRAELAGATRRACSTSQDQRRSRSAC
ncbi:MAG: hypothetical protein V9F04_14930 [Dermatophilaceae bacterium]